MNGVGVPQQRFQYGGLRVGDRLVLMSREKDVLSMLEYRPERNDWHSLTTETLAGLDDVLPMGGNSATFFAMTYDTRAGKQIAVYDFAADRWSRIPDAAKPAGEFRTYLLEDALVVVPVPKDSCGYSDWARAFILDLASGQRFEPTGEPAGDLWLPASTERIGPRLVLWGGERTAAVVDTPDCEQADARATTEGWVLDASTRSWRALAPGPAYDDRSVTAVVGTRLVLVVGTAVWRLDVDTGQWSELGAAPSTVFPDDPGFASLVAEEVAGRAAIVRMLPSGAEGVVVDPDGTVRTIARGPGAERAAEAIALDERLLVLPKDIVTPKRAAYVLDTRDASWCELAWPVPESMWRTEGSPYFRAEHVVGTRVHLWAPERGEGGGPAAGIIVDIPRW